MDWDDTLADLNAAICDSQTGVGQAITYKGVALSGVVEQRIESWLQANGSEIRETRYEAMIPVESLAAWPVVGDLLTSGDQSYSVTHAELDRGLWLLTLRQEDE